MRVARLEQLEIELQEARGSQETELQVRHAHNTHTLHTLTDTAQNEKFTHVN